MQLFQLVLLKREQRLEVVDRGCEVKRIFFFKTGEVAAFFFFNVEENVPGKTKN